MEPFPNGLIRVPALLFLLIVVALSGHSQAIRTEKTDPEYKINRRKEAPKKRRMLHLIKNDTRGILYGNRCFEEVTHKMGFEFVVQPKGQPRNSSEVGRLMHNFGVKFVLFFRNGPFWKFKLKKKRKECKRKSGDYVGP